MLFFRKIFVKLFGPTPMMARVFTCQTCGELCNSLWDMEDHEYTYHNEE